MYFSLQAVHYGLHILVVVAFIFSESIFLGVVVQTGGHKSSRGLIVSGEVAQQETKGPRSIFEFQTPSHASPEAFAAVLAEAAHTLTDQATTPTQRKLATQKPPSRPSSVATKHAALPSPSPAQQKPQSTKQPKTHVTRDPETVVAPPPSVRSLPALQALSMPKQLVHLRDAALVVLCYNRPAYLTETLDHILDAKLSKPLAKYISQDGDEFQTQAVAMSFDQFTYWSHPRTLPDTLTLNTTDESLRTKPTPDTMFLAAHYKWALDKLFFEKNHSHVIVVEDDMRVSSDFIQFFEMAAPLLDEDATIWCVSSWNDNAFPHLDLPPHTLFRTSNFPGLGWMLRRELWKELSPKFPDDNWDHWMRASTTSRNRHCVAPFLSRNFNIGVGGATSNKQFYVQYIKNAQYNRGAGEPLGDLSYLLETNYARRLADLIGRPKAVLRISDLSLQGLERAVQSGLSYVVPWVHEEYEQLASMLNIHPTPRTHCNFTVWLKFHGANILLVDRRRSLLTEEQYRIVPHPSLRAVPATSAGVSCHDVCSELTTPQAAWGCGQDQFDFINDCATLEKAFGCPHGCTQGWGEDIPNTEVWSIGRPPRCLVTEMVSTCESAFQHTRRLCPCVTKAIHASRRQDMQIVSAAEENLNCNRVCASLKNESDANSTVKWRCSLEQLSLINNCGELKRHFPCDACDVNYGPDLPNYVSSRSDGNYKKCLMMRSGSDSFTCEGAHKHTRRLCACVPSE